ncbi:hypothetical protein [Streptomyces sp. NPDC029721]|uniref:hypothetical protein n=1 Tax=Streptomyces sp. NPDC029721 TaxID=3157090 RepID=UPI0033FD4ADB
MLSGVAAGAGFGVYLAAVPDRFAAWERDALARGVAYATTRRITGELGLTAPEAHALLTGLRTAGPVRRVPPPLWRPAAP